MLDFLSRWVAHVQVCLGNSRKQNGLYVEKNTVKGQWILLCLFAKSGDDSASHFKARVVAELFFCLLSVHSHIF